MDDLIHLIQLNYLTDITYFIYIKRINFGCLNDYKYMFSSFVISVAVFWFSGTFLFI